MNEEEFRLIRRSFICRIVFTIAGAFLLVAASYFKVIFFGLAITGIISLLFVFIVKSGEMAADAVSNAINNNDFSADQFKDYGKELCKGIEAMRALVYAFYNESFSFGELIKSYPDMRGDLTDCLIGDVFKDFTKLFGAIADFATVPPKLKHGLVA